MIDCTVLFYARLKIFHSYRGEWMQNLSLCLAPHNSLWEGRDLYRAIPAVICSTHGCLIRRITPTSRGSSQDQNDFKFQLRVYKNFSTEKTWTFVITLDASRIFHILKVEFHNLLNSIFQVNWKGNWTYLSMNIIYLYSLTYN